MSPRPEKRAEFEEEEPRRSKRPVSPTDSKRTRGKAPLPGELGLAKSNLPPTPPTNYAPLWGGFLLAVVFPFLAVTLLVPQWTGVLGQSIEAGLFNLSGSTSLLVPLLILSYAMHFLLPRNRRPVQMTWAPTMLWFNLIILAQRMGSQGGRLGTLVDGALVSLVGPVGSWLIAGACLPLCILAVCRVHPQEAGHALANLLHYLQDRVGELFVWLHRPRAVESSFEYAPADSVEESEERQPQRSAVPEQPRLFSMEGPLMPAKGEARAPKAAPVRIPATADVEDSWEGEDRLPFDLSGPGSLSQHSSEFPAIPRRQLDPAAEKVTFFPDSPVASPRPQQSLEPLAVMAPVVPPPVVPPPAAGPRPVSRPEPIAVDPLPAAKAPFYAAETAEGDHEPASLESSEPYLPPAAPQEATVRDLSSEESEEESLEEDYASEEEWDEEPPPAQSRDSISPEYLEPNGQIRLFPGEVKPPAFQYKLPPLALLNDAPFNRDARPPEDKSHFLLDALASFGVQATLLEIVRGPAVTRYELQPARGVKVSRFTSLTNDIALALAATAVRIEAPIPGKSAIGIEIPNETTDLVVLKDILASSRFRKSVGLSIALGKDLGGNPTFTNLQKMPHLLVAGTTGSGKSVCVNGLILSLMYRFSPRQLQLLMIDPKQVELSIYEGIPHLISLSRTPESKNEGAIICDPKRAAMALHQIVELMEYRYGLFAAARVRNLEEFNQASEDPLPWVVVIIDELADLMMVAAKTVETSICRIAQKARAAGIHLVLATQRPSADVITGLIKVNVPSRIAFAVSSQVDSRVILDTGGAEQLLGKGDMLFCPVDASDPCRVQGCYVTNEEILRVVEWWKAQACPDNIIRLQAQEVAEENGDDDEADADDALVEQALSVICRRQQASASLLQTELKVGYARARRLIYLMEKKGYIGPAEGSKPRKILYAGGGS